MKAFNDEILGYLDGILKGTYDLEEIVDKNIPEYLDWQKKSRPFKLLATYLELLQADNNTTRDSLLRELFIEHPSQIPSAFKILIVKKMSEIMLREDVQIDQDLILAMITEFEKFESRNSLVTGKYFGHAVKGKNDFVHRHKNAAEVAVPTAERQLIRYVLNQAMSSGLIVG